MGSLQSVKSKESGMPTRMAGGLGGLELSVLGYGCWQFGSKGGKGDYWGINFKQPDATKLVKQARDGGVTYFDTAECYNDGNSERQLGQAISDLKKIDNKYADIVIGSKIPPNHCLGTTIRKHLDETLERLGVDCLDLYMVHWPIDANSMAHFSSHGAHFGPSDEKAKNVPSVKEAFTTLAALQKEGKIKHVGVSNHGVSQLKEALATGCKIAVNQLAYSLLWRCIEHEILPFCVANDIGVVAYMPLMQGLLTGRYRLRHEVPVFRARTRHFDGSRDKSRHGEKGCENETFEAIDAIRQIAIEEQCSMVDLALAYPLTVPGIVCVIAGATKPEQLAGNIQAVCRPMSPELKAKLTAATDALKKTLGSNADLWQGGDDSRIK